MKKVICLSLSLIIMICSVFAVDLSAYAKNYDSNDNNDFKTLYVNPFLENSRDEIIDELEKIDEADNQQQNNSADTYSFFRLAASYPTIVQAANTLRDSMVNRENSITVKFLSNSAYTLSAVENVFARSIDLNNSVSSRDADYLRWHIAGVSYRASSSVIDNNKYLYNITFMVTYLTNALQENRVTYMINQINKKLDLAGKSDYIKALEIHDVVCDYINYDYDYVYEYEAGKENVIKHSAYGGLVDNLAVCQSYATLYYRLCYENGLRGRIVTSTDHAWNIVNIYGKYYFVDCTWDDGIYDDPYDLAGNYWANIYGWDYFLYGKEEINDYGHILESQYTTMSFKSNYPIEDYGIGVNNCPHEASVNVPIENAQGDTDCTTGFSGKVYCRVCLLPLRTYYVPANSQHQYKKEVTDADCTSDGYTHNECTLCHYSYNDNITKATKHNYKNNITKATLAKNGKTTPVCSKCKAIKSTSTIYSPKTFTLSTKNYTYNGKAKTPSVTVKDSKGKTLVKNTDYTITYQSGRTKIGEYKVTVNFKGNYSGKKELYFTINPKITLSTTSYTYNGKAKKPSVTVKDANGKKLSSSNYKVTYASGRKNVGKYKVTIKFKNGHSGTYTKEFTIKPAKTSVSSLTAAKKALTVKWKKKTTQVTGYQIQYSTSSSFKSPKTVTISKNSTTSKKITGLSAKKKYYVRVRTYKKAGAATYYSSWSASKSVKTK